MDVPLVPPLGAHVSCRAAAQQNSALTEQLRGRSCFRKTQDTEKLILQRFLELLCIYGDGTIGLTTGEPLRLLEDAQIIKPHTMAGVPRVWNRYVPLRIEGRREIADRQNLRRCHCADGGRRPQGRIGHSCGQYQARELAQDRIRQTRGLRCPGLPKGEQLFAIEASVSDANEQIRALLGGRLEFVTSGAAPLSPEVHEMLKIAFCCDAIQGVSLHQ